MSNQACIIALKYEEPEYKETIKCIEATGAPVFWADRDGVGNYSRALNEAVRKLLNAGIRFEYIWMISNIIFDKGVLPSLVKAMNNNPQMAAIHPSMPTSDHVHQHTDGSFGVKEVPFIEWTAPIVRFNVFANMMLDEKLAYYYMDLSWSHEVKKAGMKVGVDHSVAVGHVYLRNKKSPHPISAIRAKLRDYWTPISQKHMHDKYGPDWKNLMNWKP